MAHPFISRNDMTDSLPMAEMNTEAARALVENRHAFLEEFKQRFETEWFGSASQSALTGAPISPASSSVSTSRAAFTMFSILP